VAVVAYLVACQLLPRDSLSLVLVSDLGFVLIEAVVLLLCYLAVRQATSRHERHLWGWLGGWVALNLFADGAWAYYELVRQVEPPLPGVPDIGYLASYFVAFGGITVLAYWIAGKHRALATALDSLIFTTGITSLSWPLVLRPLLDRAESRAEFLATLAYPAGDLLVILAIVSLVLGTWGSGRVWPRYHVFLVSLAFMVQAVADSAYFVMTAQGVEYGPGSLLDPIWLLAFVLVGAAAARASRLSSQVQRCDAGKTILSASELFLPQSFDRSSWTYHIVQFLRLSLPYSALPMLAGSFLIHANRGWGSLLDVDLLFGTSFALVVLILVRQYIALRANQVLNQQLQATQAELQKEIRSLSELTHRLQSLNRHLERLQRLRSPADIARAAVELACACEGSPGGWITLLDSEGQSRLIASWGAAKQGARKNRGAAGKADGSPEPRAINLESGGRTLGTLYLLPSNKSRTEPDMLPAIAGHVATALDNASRYEEAVDLAEKDPLTGIYNRRGIYKRLAGELLRAQQTETPLAVIMTDLDNFKNINDTFGHPAGDGALRHLTQRILSALRHADLVGRVGGDEILVVLPNTTGEGARQVARRLLEEIAHSPYPVASDCHVPLKISLGIAAHPDDAQTLNELIKRADINLYLAKQMGGNIASGGRKQAAAAETSSNLTAEHGNSSAKADGAALQDLAAY